MQKLIILRGVPASGKSAIAKKLRNFKQKIAWLKVDNFKSFFSEDASKALNFVNESAIATLEYLLNEGFSVVMEGVFQNPKYITLATKVARKKNIPFKIFEIECSLTTLQARDKNRPGVKEGCRRPLGDKVISRLYKVIKAHPYKNSTILNTEKLSLDKCVKAVKQEFNN